MRNNKIYQYISKLTKPLSSNNRGNTMSLKRFFIRHTYAIFAAIILLMLVFFTSQIVHMKSQFNDTMKNAELKFNENLDDAMMKRERQINRLQAGISQDNLRRWDIISTEKIIASVNKKLSDETRHQYATYIVDEVQRYGNIDLMVWLSLITQESRFRANAKSHMSAVGLAQIMPRTARGICKELGIPYHDDMRLDPKMNLKMSAWLLSDLMNDYKNIELVLAHYNGGVWQKNSWMYTKMFKHTPEYKSMTVTELRAKVATLEVEIPFDERQDGKTELAKEYNKFSKILRAKLLVKETADYVPEVLNRARQFEKFYNKPNALNPVIKDNK
jgi:hypothetical protein